MRKMRTGYSQARNYFFPCLLPGPDPGSPAPVPKGSRAY